MLNFKDMDTKERIKMIAGSIFLVVLVSTYIFSDSDRNDELETTNNATSVAVTEQPETINHENLLYKVNFYSGTIRDIYKGKSVSFARFSQLKQNLEKELNPRCSTYDLLVEQTGGNLKSPYASERTDCKDIVIGMTQYLFAIRDNDKPRMNNEFTKLKAIISRFEKSLEQYKKSEAEIDALMASFKSN